MTFLFVSPNKKVIYEYGFDNIDKIEMKWVFNYYFEKRKMYGIYICNKKNKNMYFKISIPEKRMGEQIIKQKIKYCVKKYKLNILFDDDEVYENYNLPI
jgi:hypothetical protein